MKKICLTCSHVVGNIVNDEELYLKCDLGENTPIVVESRYCCENWKPFR